MRVRIEVVPATVSHAMVPHLAVVLILIDKLSEQPGSLLQQGWETEYVPQAFLAQLSS